MNVMTNRKMMPPTYFWLYCGVSVLTTFIPVGHVVHFPFNLIGIAVIAAGLMLAMWVERVFKSAETTVKPYEHSSALVTTGPFRLSRNPMYLGMTIIFIGIAIVLESYLALIGAVLFLGTMNLMFVPAEEKKLERDLGSDYAAYRRKVRRWL